MLDANLPIFSNDESVPPGKQDRSARRRLWTTSIVRGIRGAMTASAFCCLAFLLCQCHRQPPTAEPTPTASPTTTPATTSPAPTPATASPTPTPAEASPAPASPAPTAHATVTSTPTASATETPTVSASPLSSPSPPPDPFEEGIKKLLRASENGFLELRGKLKRTENGSGPDPLFRVRRIYEGNFLFGGAALAELEEVYFTAGQQPAYNYQLYYQALSTRASIEKYDDFRLHLNQILQGFEHTFGDRYDAWARDDARKTAVLLSSQEATGSPQIQVHVAFSSPQW